MTDVAVRAEVQLATIGPLVESCRMRYWYSVIPDSGSRLDQLAVSCVATEVYVPWSRTTGVVGGVVSAAIAETGLKRKTNVAPPAAHHRAKKSFIRGLPLMQNGQARLFRHPGRLVRPTALRLRLPAEVPLSRVAMEKTRAIIVVLLQTVRQETGNYAMLITAEQCSAYLDWLNRV